MEKIIFICKCMKEFCLKRMWQHAGKVARRSHKSRLRIFWDMLWCGFRYQAGYLDYELFRFENLDAAKRRTYVTRGVNNRIVKSFNNLTGNRVLKNKLLFHRRFADFTGRGYLDMKTASIAEFRAWCADKKDFIIKPYEEGCGVGVKKIVLNDNRTVEELYAYIRSTDSLLAEETAKQHEKMNALYPCAVNTVRVVTVRKPGSNEVSIPFTAVRIGNGGRVVDNINNGGMCSVVDTADGTILYDAADKDFCMYKKHPLTQTQIKGFVIPMWDEVLSCARRAALRLDDIGYCGWDVCITPDRPILIEGNDYPGHDIYQMPGMIENGIGILARFEAATGMRFYDKKDDTPGSNSADRGKIRATV